MVTSAESSTCLHLPRNIELFQLLFIPSSLTIFIPQPCHHRRKSSPPLTYLAQRVLQIVNVAQGGSGVTRRKLVVLGMQRSMMHLARNELSWRWRRGRFAFRNTIECRVIYLRRGTRSAITAIGGRRTAWTGRENVHRVHGFVSLSGRRPDAPCERRFLFAGGLCGA